MKLNSVSKICLVILAISSSTLKSQEASVEKSIFGVQTGFWGVWGYNEAKLSQRWALRTEVGLFDYWGLIEGINLEPVITVEPRRYLNLYGRRSKGKRINHNSGLFIAFRLAYRPGLFNIPVDVYESQKNPSIALVPFFGARKPLSKNWHYELGFGLGVEYFSKGTNVFGLYDGNDNVLSLAFNFQLRVGLNL